MDKENKENTHSSHFEKVCVALGFGNQDYMQDVIKPYYDSVILFMETAGVKAELLNTDKTIGIVARGVSDIWSYNSGSGTLSKTFQMMLVQLI